MTETELVRVDPFRLKIPQSGQMVTEPTVYASSSIDLEPKAVSQLRDAASLPTAYRALATADIHVGFGVPIGAVIGLQNAIMPPAVGYDINCGMRLLHTPFQKGQIDTDKIAESIARDVPLGEGMSNVVFNREQFHKIIKRGVPALSEIAGKSNHRMWEAFDHEELTEDCRRIEEGGSMDADPESVPNPAVEKGRSQLGTLGGGNHFIEIQYVQKIFDGHLAAEFGLSQGQITVMVHSGSRRFGYEVADYYMDVAARRPDMKDRRKMLAYLPADSKEGRRYIGAMHAAANFAFTNRHIMAMLVRRCFNRMFGPTPLKLIYDVTHNMAKLEVHDGRELWVHRKGATRAFGPAQMKNTPFAGIGQPVITPGSMGTASYLMVGTGDSAESLNSVNHGAGRVMSRSAALGKVRRGKVITPARIADDEFKRSMAGIKLIAGNKRKVKEEAPGAYKDIDEVVRIVVECGWARRVARLVPLAVLKG